PSMRLWRPPDHLSRDDLGSKSLDMQGIRWQMVGPSRSHALAARCLLHPSKLQAGQSQVDAAASVGCTAASSCHVLDETAYRFKSFAPIHRAQSCHYQLRNVIAAPGRSSIFYANRDRVMHTSLACPTTQQTAVDLSLPTTGAPPFRTTCLTASASTAGGSSYLLAGGFDGEYAIAELASSSAATPNLGFVTHASNGLVTHIHTYDHRHGGLPVAAFCSNDHKIRLMDLGTLTFTSTFAYQHAVNCSATSPDGRLRVIVGDSRDAHITDAERGHSLVKLSEHTEHGFACAWAPNGIHVATGAQDGKTLIWDARKWSQPVHSSASVMSCPRSLHFTDEGALVVAESEDVVTILEGASFERRQDIRFFGSIAGVALLDGGAELVVGNADKTVGGLLTFRR
ncbi:hypothetical protein BAUCODRAFT_59535, partial [Baudoinia panamericana UAMH 10762]